MPLPLPPPGLRECLESFRLEDTGRDCKNWKANHLAEFSKSVWLPFTTSQDLGPWKLEIGRMPVTELGVNELER